MLLILFFCFWCAPFDKKKGSHQIVIPTITQSHFLEWPIRGLVLSSDAIDSTKQVFSYPPPPTHCGFRSKMIDWVDWMISTPQAPKPQQLMNWKCRKRLAQPRLLPYHYINFCLETSNIQVRCFASNFIEIFWKMMHGNRYIWCKMNQLAFTIEQNFFDKTRIRCL